MNRGNQNRNINHRSGDGRRPYQNNYNSRNNNNWNDRNKGQYEWRSDSPRNGNRIESRQQSSQSTHLPGIPVNRNLSSTPFASNETKVDVCANGSGDQIGDQKSLESLNTKLSQMDLKPKDCGDQKDVTTTNDEEVVSITEKSTAAQPITPEVKTEIDPQLDSNEGSKVVSISGVNSYSQRRYTVGSDYRFNNFRTFRRNGNENNHFNGQKFERSYNQNKMQTNDTNKRIISGNNNMIYNNNRGLKRYPPPKNDFIGCVPYNPYIANVREPYQPCPQFFLPNPYYNVPYNYGVPTPMPQNVGTEMATQPNQSQMDRSGKFGEQTTSSGVTDMSGVGAYFVPFKPSDDFPVAPTYYGHILSYSTDKGIIHYFQALIPPHIAPLPLDVDNGSGLPILPSNCITIVPYSE